HRRFDTPPRLASAPPPRHYRVGGDGRPLPDRGRAGRRGTEETAPLVLPPVAAELPNECWRAEVTHYPLADGTDTEILSWLDDHSRYPPSVTAPRRVTGPIVLASFRETAAQHGTPASTLTD